MIKACEKASKIIIRDFGEVENLQVAKKGPRDFVTKTDKRVEEILVEELTRAKKIIHFLLKKLEKLIIMIKIKFGLLIQLMEQQIFYMEYPTLQFQLH